MQLKQIVYKIQISVCYRVGMVVLPIGYKKV